MGKRRNRRKITAPTIPTERRKLHFSLKYLDTSKANFTLDRCTKDFYDALFAEIKRYGSMSVDHFRNPEKNDHRHLIDFQKTTEMSGFSHIDPGQDRSLWTDEPWQFGLKDCMGKATDWRVHGFIADDFFYIVWLDPDHKLGG